MTVITEPEKQVPVAFDVDVIVAGAGVSGVFAAIAAARRRAKTLLIDRFGRPGGNIGPGLIAGGSLSGWPVPHLLHGPFFGLPKEFVERHAGAGGGSVPPYSKNHYLKDSNTATYVLLKMLEEAGVKLMLSAWACDPIVQDGRVAGVFIESKSGRQAARGQVVIDATGEADLSRRAGAPVIYPTAEYYKSDLHAPTGTGIYYVVAGVDWDAYENFKRTCPDPDEQSKRWAQDLFGPPPPPHLLPLLKKAAENGDFCSVLEIEGLGKIAHHRELDVLSREEGLACRMLNLKTPWVDARTRENLNAADGAQLSLLEAKLRIFIFELARFFRLYVPGFERCYLTYIAPFLGARGGPCIEGQYTVTLQDMQEGRKFPDVLFVHDHVGDLKNVAYTGQWTDFPYRAMVPKRPDGLLAVGRNASCRPDTLLRGRAMVMHMGEAAGTAAALSAEHGVTPRQLDVRQLQEALLDVGYYLGDTKRLRELGLL